MWTAWLGLLLAAVMLLQTLGLSTASNGAGYPAQVFADTWNGVTVTVEAPSGALPDGARMVLSEADADAIAKLGVSDELAVDISFRAGFAEIEPLRPVRVSFNGLDGEKSVLHIADDGTLSMPTVEAAADGLRFYTDAFSTFVLVDVYSHTLSAENENCTVTVSYNDDAKIPENAVLAIRELTKGEAGYDAYLQRIDDTLEGERLAYCLLVDISILADEAEVQPAAPVRVDVRLNHEAAPGETISLLHFPSEPVALEPMTLAPQALSPQSLSPQAALTVDAPADKAPEAPVPEAVPSTMEGDTLTFTASGFSVYAIVGTIIETYILASDGKNYKVTVAYGVETGIPEGAELEVEEILPGEIDDASTSSAYDEYVSKAENALGMEEGSAGYIRLFDIKIVDKDDHSVKYQPAKGTAVDVRIELADASDAQDLGVVHFANAYVPGDVVNAGIVGQTVEFEAAGFSIYAIMDKEDYQSVARAKIVFQNADGSPFKFLNNAGNTVDNQIIHSGSVLEEVGMPSIDVSGQTFQGWYIYDTANGSYTNYQLRFGGSNTWTVNYGDTKSITSSTAVVTSENADEEGCVFYARPYFGKVSYLTFYNESAGDNESLGGHGIILNRVQVIKGTTYDISEQKATPPDATWNEETESWVPVSYVFTGWSNDAGRDDDNRTAITNTTITMNGDQSFYPIFKQGHWVTFFSAPSGSGADYIPAKIILSTQTTLVARPTTNPTWKGHTFVGWFTTPEAYDPDNENYTNANGTINPAYNGFFSTNETAAGAYAFNESLNDDLTLYAHWNVGTANVTVVKWQQVVTDDKNATTPTKEQMVEEGYASNAGLKHYEYAGQQNLDETVNSIQLNSQIPARPLIFP